LFIPYFSAPTHVADADVPYSHRTCTPSEQFEGTAAFKMQLELSNIFNKNKASLKLYDDTIALFQQYIRGDDFNTFTPLSTREQLFAQVERIFRTDSLKPTYGRVRLTNDNLATVPVFDVKSMILSMVHDKSLMKEENFAAGLDIFTGNVDTNCDENNSYGEIHTGDAWEPARDKFCGRDGKYMPFGMIIFGALHTRQRVTN